MKSYREKSAFPQHTLESRSELDLGNRETVAEVKRSIHIGVGEGSKPFAIVCFAFSGRVDLEDFLVCPAFLSSLFKIDQEVAFPSL